MEAYLNDLSTGSLGLSLIDNFDKLHKFISLSKYLNRFGFANVIIDQKFRDLELCGVRIPDCIESMDFEHRNLVLQLQNHFVHKPSLDVTKIFFHDSYPDSPSVLLGHAHEFDRPVVSFTFDDVFAVDHIVGKRENGRNARVLNLYDSKQDGLTAFSLVSRKECGRYNPLNDPFWNSEATRKFHDSINEELLSLPQHPEEKIAMLSRYAHVIAELNGWELDEHVTAVNRKKYKAMRQIYRSEKFTKTAYISVDFEKVDIFFELCDKRGCHKGEYSWNGVKSEEADTKGNHDIEVS